MCFKKPQYGIKHRRIAQPFPQIVGRNAGKGEQTTSARVIAQRPRQRRKRQRLIIFTNCFPQRHRLLSLHELEGMRVTKRVLVVEDNELNLKLFCDLLRAHAYDTEGVKDAREAIERATLFAPEIIIMDIQMPHISGLELIVAIKRDVVLRRIPIMAVTAYAGTGDEERIRDAGADAYVSKPISLMRFIESVKILGEIADSRAMA
jgi:two-component system, cell cycle response regulator DivK